MTARTASRPRPDHLDEEDFPHGTVTGYNKGCIGMFEAACPATPTCHQVRSGNGKRSRFRRAGILPPADHDTIPSGPTLALLDELMGIDGVSYLLLGELSGVSQKSLWTLHNRRGKRVHRSTHRKLSRLNPAQVRADLDATSPKKAIQTIKSMQVQAFSIKWQAEQIGRSRAWFTAVMTGRFRPSREDVIALLRLADRVEGQTGTDPCGAGRARNEGWHPAACYDRFGDLIPGSVRTAEDDAQEQLTARARQILDILWARLTTTETGPQIAEKYGTTESDVANLVRKTGLKFTRGDRMSTIVKEAYRKDADAYRRLLVDHVNDAGDPVEFVTEALGIPLGDDAAEKAA